MSDITKSEDARESTEDPNPLVPEAASTTPLSTVQQLAMFHGRGLLSDAEFRLAKERIIPTDGS